MKRFFAAVVLATCCLAAAPASASPPSTSELAAVAQLFDRINTYRASAGRDPLTEDAFIDRKSYRHSVDMARTQVLSHKGFRRRANAIQADNPNLQVLCENVAYVSGSFTAVDAADRIFNGWMNSPPHDACMRDVDADTAGIGIQKSGRTWWATFIAANDSTI